jgi:hypothetical protein
MPGHCEQPRAKRTATTPTPRVAASLVTHPLQARGALQTMRAQAMQLNAGRANRTGIPDDLKRGMEGMSGVSLDDVTVHRNSAEPARFAALAYAQGNQVHLGPGQERHLAHEVAHVVQQKQDLVRATGQALGQPLNDEAGLEREADLLGARAASARASGDAPTPDAAIQPRMPIQRQPVFLLDQAAVPPGMKGMHGILVRLLETEKKLESKLPGLATIPGLPKLLFRLMHDKGRHDTFDLDSEQGAAFLTYELLSLGKAPQPVRNGKDANGGSGGQTASASSKPQASGGSSKAFETVFLGAGASIAYYLAAGRGQYSPSASIIIGLDDPWGGKRGPGVVAHPESMITPMLEFLGQKTDSVWTERGKFAQLVATVIQRSGLPLIREKVLGVEEMSDGTYLVSTTGEPVRARNVVGGMGSGEHRPPREVDASAIAAKPGDVAENPKQNSAIAKRVMNMDVFTRVADRIYGASGSGGSAGSTAKLMLAPEGKTVPGREARAGIHVVLSGGNGGIDVAFTALQKGFRVTWLVGAGGPRFLEGFFNYAAKYAMERSAQFSATNRRAASVDGKQRVAEIRQHLEQLYAGQDHVLLKDVVDYFAEAARFEAVHFADAGAVSLKGTQVDIGVVLGDRTVDTVSGDLYVYAHGQDGSALQIFESLRSKMTPVIDQNFRFLSPTSRESPGVKSGQVKQQDTVLGMEHRSKSGGSLKLIGAAGFRHPDQKPSTMRPVIDSLPPNVLLNDQLTPSRSQIEAQLDYVRPNIASVADFITDDRTQLAMHITARYPFVRGPDIEQLTATIIRSRTDGFPKAPAITAVPPNSARFQKAWEARLIMLNEVGKLKKEGGIKSKL